mgnify:CR=1 FL=1
MLKKITGVWVNKTKKGESYLTFKINGIKYAIFKNKKTKENQPDFYLCSIINQEQNCQQNYQYKNSNTINVNDAVKNIFFEKNNKTDNNNIPF